MKTLSKMPDKITRTVVRVYACLQEYRLWLHLKGGDENSMAFYPKFKTREQAIIEGTKIAKALNADLVVEE